MISDSLVQGYPPRIVMGPGNPEAQKYGRLWEMDQYRTVAPGELFASRFLELATPIPGAHVIDFGCGTGRGARRLCAAGLRITMLDFVSNCLDDDVRAALGDGFEFVKHDLETPAPVVAEYGYCTDVLEHLPSVRVPVVLDHILRAAQNVFFAISTQEDRLGALVDAQLHLTVRDAKWWRERLDERGCKVFWSDNQSGYAFFYVSAWEDASIVVENGVINTTAEQIRANVGHNCRQGWTQVVPHETQETEVVILGGGPSLGDFEPKIRELKAAGAKIVTLNGAYHWALGRGLGPVTQVVVDARAFNSRFTRPARDDCKYLIASQCDPSIFEGLSREQTYLWHAAAAPVHDLLAETYGDGGWYPTPGGSTVLLRAIPLLRLLGFYRFHIFGCDSCITDDGEHHAFPQPENDGEVVVPVTVTGGRVFRCAPWMVSQAHEWMGLIRDLGDVVDLCVYGNGLLAHIIEAGADFSTERN